MNMKLVKKTSDSSNEFSFVSRASTMAKPLLYYTPDSPPCQVCEKLLLFVGAQQYCLHHTHFIIIHRIYWVAHMRNVSINYRITRSITCSFLPLLGRYLVDKAAQLGCAGMSCVNSSSIHSVRNFYSSKMSISIRTRTCCPSFGEWILSTRCRRLTTTGFTSRTPTPSLRIWPRTRI